MIATFALAALLVSGTPLAAADRVSAIGLYYRLEGTGPDIVLIHGFHTDLREWDDVTATLRASHRVLRYDVRGHGRSTIPATLPASADDLRALLDELQISRVTIVGLSMGATIALDFALTHPAYVDRLVLISPGIPGIAVTANRDWMKPIAQAVRSGNPRRAAELWWDGPILDGVSRYWCPGRSFPRDRSGQRLDLDRGCAPAASRPSSGQSPVGGGCSRPGDHRREGHDGRPGERPASRRGSARRQSAHNCRCWPHDQLPAP